MRRDDDSLAPAKECLQTDNLEVSCLTERFKGAPLMETSIDIKGACTIAWKDRENFALALQEVIEKYKL